jgi:hypothetical protein
MLRLQDSVSGDRREGSCRALLQPPYDRTVRVFGLILSHAFERPDRYGASRRFETMPSSPSGVPEDQLAVTVEAL